MTLRIRVTSFVMLLFVILGGSLFLLINGPILDRFRVLERDSLSRNVDRVSESLRTIQDALAQKCDEWAHWDETYKYVVDWNESYYDSNLVVESFQVSHLSHIIFLNDRGQVLRGVRLNEDGETVSPLNLEETSAVNQLSKYFVVEDPEGKASGIARLNNELFLISAAPITDSKLVETPRGFLLFARKFDDDVKSSIASTTKLDLAFRDPRERYIQQLRGSLAPLPKQPSLTASFVERESVIQSVADIPAITGDVIVVAEIKLPRDIYAQGVSTRDFVSVGVLLATFAAAMLTLLFMNRVVLSPLAAMGREATAIGTDLSTKQRISPTTAPEFNVLVNRINGMISALEDARIATEIARDAAQAANLAKSTFVAKVSHELRTPIHSIVGMLRILFKEERSTAKRDYIKMARDAAYSLLGTINDILDFSKIESGNLTLETVPLNLRELVRETLRTVGPRAEEKEGLELVGYIDPKIPDALLGDPLRIKQSIINLLSNAVKFTAAGSVTVDVELVAVSSEKTEITISVRDTGVGIPEHRLHKIFDPFTQADESVARVFQGTGLGLTIVKQLVEAMGGSVTVTSRIGLGTDFVLRIPFARPQPAVDWELPKPRSSGKAIVVDTQTAASELWRKFFKTQGFSTTWINTRDDTSLARIGDIANESEFMVFTEEALQRSAVFNFVVETAGQINHCPMVAVLSPFAISLREKLLSLSVRNVLVRPCLPDDILLSLAGRLEVGDHVWDGDVDFVSEVSSTLNILIADDTYTNRFILQSMLEEGGHTVTAVTNGQELYDLLSASITDPKARKYDIIFTDVQMPIMDGITATQKIRQLESTLEKVHSRIVAVTAHAMTEEKTRMRDSGVDEVITKPVEPSEVARVLVKACEEIAQSGQPQSQTAAAGTPIRQTKIVLGNELDLQAVASRVWTQFLESGGDLGDLVQTAVDGQEFRTDQEGLQSFLNVQETFERSGGSVRRTIMIFKAFLGSFKDILAHVAHAKSERNTDELRKASHSLKGILLEVGAKNPGSVAGNVEQLCNAGKLEEALKLITPVTHQTLAAARILEKIVEAVEIEQNQGQQTVGEQPKRQG